MQPINQLVDKTNNKNNAATIFRLPNNFVGAQGAIIEADISKTQKIKEVDHLKTNSNPSGEVIFKDNQPSTPTDNGNSGYGSLIISTANGKTDYKANETVTVAVMSNSNVLRWTVEGVDITQVTIQPQQTNSNNTKVINLVLKDPSIIKANTPVKITATDEQNKKKGTVAVTFAVQDSNNNGGSTPPQDTNNWTLSPTEAKLTASDFVNNGIVTYGRDSGSSVYPTFQFPSPLSSSDFTITKRNDQGQLLKLLNTNSVTDNAVYTLTLTSGSVSHNLTITILPSTNSSDNTTYKVTVGNQSYEASDTANLGISPANTNFTVEGIDNSLLDITTYFSSTGVGDGKPGSTNVYIQPKNPESITQDYTVTLKVNDNGKVSSASYTLKKYKDKTYDNTVNNSDTVQGHLNRYLDINDRARLSNSNTGGPYTVKVNDATVGTFDTLADIKIDGVTTYIYSGSEFQLFNNTNDYKVIDIIGTQVNDLRADPNNNYSSIETLPNTTYDGSKTNTVYLAPKRDEYRSNTDVDKAKQQRYQTNVVRLKEDTSNTTPQRATLIIDDKYAYVDENFTGSFNNLLTKANIFINPQDSASLIAIYAASNTTKNIDAKLIVSDKRDPTDGMTVSPTNSLYYDKASNITSFFLPAANQA